MGMRVHVLHPCTHVSSHNASMSMSHTLYYNIGDTDVTSVKVRSQMIDCKGCEDVKGAKDIGKRLQEGMKAP